MMIPFEPFEQVRGGFLGRHCPPDIAVDQFVELKQVHGARILFLGGQGDIARVHQAEADALLCSSPGIPIAVRSADCVPILAAHPRGLIAAVHAGWRGTLSGILGKTLARIRQDWGFPLEELRLSIGPAICGKCYLVGEDVAGAYQSQLGTNPPRDANAAEKFHLDLKAANFAQAVSAGVPISHIEIREECTRCHEGRFFSHRGALAVGKKNAGRNHSWVMLTTLPR